MTARPAASAGRLAGNVAANVGGYVLTAAVAFLVWPLELHRLGDQAFGLWALLGQLIGYAGLLDFGVRIAVVRNMARAQARGEDEASARLLSTAVTMMLAPAVVIAGAGLWLGFWLPAHLGVSVALAGPARVTIWLAAATVALAAPGALFNGCVAAISRYDLLNLRNAAVQIARGLLLWYFLVHGYGLVAVAAIFLATETLGQGLDVCFSMRQCSGLRLSWRGFDIRLVRELLDFGFFAFLISIAVRLVYWSDNVVVGLMAGATAVAFYAVAGSLAQYLRDGIANLTKVFAPLTAQLDGLGQQEHLRTAYRYGSKAGVMLILPGVLFLVLDGHEFLRLWMGAAMAARASMPLALLALSALTMPLAAMYSNVLYATARHRVNGWVAMTEAVANVGLSVALIGPMGISGVALGTLAPAVVVQLGVMPMYTCRVLGISLRRYLHRALGRPLLAAAPVAVLAAAAARSGWIVGWERLILSGALLGAAYAVSAALVACNREERHQVMGILRRQFAGRHRNPAAYKEAA
ncbi:MAG: lipopolysaccharide biosynthesis protein [Terriglobales bacterium]